MSVLPMIVSALIVLGFIFLHMRRRKVVKENIRIANEFLTKNALGEEVKSTSSGLQYKVLTKGEGAVFPNPKSKVTVHYHGTLIDGTVFDSSIERGKSISFALNRVIKGWVEGVQLMAEGDKFQFYIPSHLAYGSRHVGKIPAGSLLIFDIELIAIN